MNVDQARDFLRQNHRAVVATMRADGGVQMSPVLISLDSDGRAVVSTTEAAVKVKNLRRHPYAYATVLNDRFYGAFVQIEGPVTIVSLPEAMDGLVEYYRSVSGEHPDWDDYRQAMIRDERVLIKIEITRAGPSTST